MQLETWSMWNGGSPTDNIKILLSFNISKLQVERPHPLFLNACWNSALATDHWDLTSTTLLFFKTWSSSYLLWTLIWWWRVLQMRRSVMFGCRPVWNRWPSKFSVYKLKTGPRWSENSQHRFFQISAANTGVDPPLECNIYQDKVTHVL